MSAFVMLTAFNAHASESNLINTGKRLPGETIRNNPAKKIITRKEELDNIRRAELKKTCQGRIKLAKAPWE